MYYSYNRSRPRQNGDGRALSFRRIGRHKSFDPSLYISKLKLEKLPNSRIETQEKFVPKHAFLDFPISETLKRNIARRGYLQPTPIQDESIPPILAGRDVVGLANTGTGKTAAFLIPLIHRASQNRSLKVLIITPTRELAAQIQEEFVAFAQGMSLHSVLCIGGVRSHPQSEKLRLNPQFVIGTPGRLKDLEMGRKLNFSTFNAIVLDEVDRMLDIGFIQEIKYIISSLGRDRHSLFFSATLTPQVQEVMRGFLNNPITVSVKVVDNLESVHQETVRIKGQAKIEVLHDLLIKEGFSKVLLFGRTKHGMEKLSRELDSRGFKVASIHGNKNQSQRQRALKEFKSNQVQILLATDVASRGLDINDVTHVINYDLPESYEDYIHRIGRTGRANKSGIALTFVE